MTRTLQEFIASAAIVALLMAFVAVIELAVPLYASRYAWRKRGPTNLTLMIITFTLNWLLSTAAPVFALTFSCRPSVMVSLGVPLLVQIVASVVVLDLFTYVAHWSMHKVPLFWRFHRAHHSDPFVDVTTSYRQHPIEAVFRYAWVIIPALFLGLPAAGIVVYRLISAVNAIFEHANVAVPRRFDRLVSWVWVTPNMHKIHHSREPLDTESNYGNILAIYDRLLRTFTSTDRAFQLAYGLKDTEPRRAMSLRGLLWMPFQGARQGARTWSLRVRRPS